MIQRLLCGQPPLLFGRTRMLKATPLAPFFMQKTLSLGGARV